MQTIWISDRVRLKLAEKHGGVSDEEIRQCFENLEPGWNYIRDTRDGHYSDPPTYWFISETNRRRQLGFHTQKAGHTGWSEGANRH